MSREVGIHPKFGQSGDITSVAICRSAMLDATSVTYECQHDSSTRVRHHSSTNLYKYRYHSVRTSSICVPLYFRRGLAKEDDYCFF